MAQARKAEVQIQVKCSAHKFYECLKYNFHRMHVIYRGAFPDCQVLEGDGISVGSLRLSKYILPGTNKLETVKARTRKVDDKNMLIALFVEEGDLKDLYPQFTLIIQVTPKGEGAMVKWSVEFEKKNNQVPDPHIYLELYKKMNEKIEAHILKS